MTIRVTRFTRFTRVTRVIRVIIVIGYQEVEALTFDQKLQ